MRELDDRNSDDAAIKKKICDLCDLSLLVDITGTALADLGLIPLTKDSVLAAVKEHILTGRRVFTDRMDNHDIAYVITECVVEDNVLYVKVKFFRSSNQERMVVISAHPPRRWW